MKTESVNRSRKLSIRLKPGEYQKIYTSFKNTTKRKLSEYIRYVLLDKPVTVYTRSKSLDDFMAELILLRNELAAIGNNYNQTVKKLHSLDHVPAIHSWAVHNEKSKEIFMQKINEINDRIAKFSDKWLQE